MDLFTAFIDFLNLSDNTSYFKEACDKLMDRDEYLGIRIVNFLTVLFSIIAILFFFFVIYLLLKKIN